MNRAVEMIFDTVAEFVKFMFMLFIFILAAQYLNLYIAADRILYTAELEGEFTRASVDDWLDVFNIDNSRVRVVKSEPSLNIEVERLGAPMYIELEQELDFQTLGEGIDFKITIVKKGINHGHYGTEGYGNYNLED